MCWSLRFAARSTCDTRVPQVLDQTLTLGVSISRKLLLVAHSLIASGVRVRFAVRRFRSGRGVGGRRRFFIPIRCDGRLALMPSGIRIRRRIVRTLPHAFLFRLQELLEMTACLAGTDGARARLAR